MKKKILFVVSLLFGLMFIVQGAAKFVNFMPVPDDLPEGFMKMMGAFAQIGWVIPLLGIVEIIAGLLFIFPKTRALGAIVIFPIMIGILLTHITAIPQALPMSIALLAVNLWVIFEEREKYLPMIR